jgi:hypothetical protein
MDEREVGSPEVGIHAGRMSARRPEGAPRHFHIKRDTIGAGSRTTLGQRPATGRLSMQEYARDFQFS